MENRSRSPQDGVRVLVIDDDPLVRDIVGALLALNGYRVTTARNGQEGLRRFADEGHDVVITDVYMPGLDGWEVARRLRAVSQTVGIVVMSASLDTGDADHRSIPGPMATLAKPFALEQLLTALKGLRAPRQAVA